jgi:transcriptional regulator with XRE-family HTH domain
VGEAERHYRSFLDFLKFVENRDEIADDATFSRILHHALTEFPISQSALSQRLGYANSQIGRWMTGRAAPHVLVRPQVIEVLAAMLEEALEDLRSNNRSIVQAFDIKDGFSRKGETH